MHKSWRKIAAACFLPWMAATVLAGDAGKAAYVPAPKEQRDAQVGLMPKPDYPVQFRRMHYEAHMGLRIYVAENGRVDRVETAGYEGDRPLVDHASAFVQRNWRFRPFSVRGKPAAVVFVVPISFLLDNSRLRKNTDIIASIYANE